MSFPDHQAQQQQQAFVQHHFSGGGDVGSVVWPPIMMNNEQQQPDLHSHYEQAQPPPFKRQRNFENIPTNPAPFALMNPRINLQSLPVNKGTTHIFFKTRICVKFMEGNCRNGESCTFAHGAEELRQPPPNWQDLVSGRGGDNKDRGAGDWNDDQRIIHRMKICKKFYNGEECPYGDKCNFLHEVPSKFKTTDQTMPMPMPMQMQVPMAMAMARDSSVISIGTMGQNMGPTMGHKIGSDQIESHKYGNASAMAIASANAAADAFRANMKPVFWKTRLCSKWEATGYCPFSERCHFAHGQSELQVAGNRETEVMNGVSIPVDPIPAPADDAFPATASAIPPTGESNAKNNLSRWKLTKKINRIYADWIDDLTPPSNQPSSSVES